MKHKIIKSENRLAKNLIQTPTGSLQDDKNLREVIYPFGKYEIKIIVDEIDRFIGISEIRLNKDFRTISQKIESTGYVDVEDFYREEQ